MSIKSFFSSLAGEVKSMWKKAPAAEVVLASAVNALVPEVEILDEVLVPEAAPKLNLVLDKVKVGLSALKSTIQGAGSNANVQSIAASINANLLTLASAAQIKNPDSLAKVKLVATTVTAAVQEIATQHAATVTP